MNRTRSFIIVSLLGLLFLSIYTHFSNTESYLNYVSHSDINHDYDRDGDSETSQNHTPEMLKLVQLVLVPTVAYLEPQASLHSLHEVIPTDTRSHLKSQYILAIFRPPIAA